MAYDLLRYDNTPTKHIEFENGEHGLDNVADKAAEAILDWMAEMRILEKIR